MAVLIYLLIGVLVACFAQILQTLYGEGNHHSWTALCGIVLIWPFYVVVFVVLTVFFCVAFIKLGDK